MGASEIGMGEIIATEKNVKQVTSIVLVQEKKLIALVQLKNYRKNWALELVSHININTQLWIAE